jgi:pSer/pThr/pTyr-binding forkhead associated (FHA) protein
MDVWSSHPRPRARSSSFSSGTNASFRCRRVTRHRPAADALVSVASDRVSRRHALIVVTGDTAAIQDLDSKNGTYVGATRIDRTVELKNGDRILVGPAMLIFRARPDDDSTASATRV